MERIKNEVIDFSKYEDISDPEKLNLAQVLAGWRYKDIANKENCSESVIKKRMQAIFKKLDVPDLNGFLMKFGGRVTVGLPDVQPVK